MDSKIYRSNCIIETWRARRRLKKQGIESYRLSRDSRFNFSPFHMGWGVLDSSTGQIRMFSFKPVGKGVDVPWYLAPTRLIFKGRIVEGDAP
jgi:hypothetical protein